jgi:myo-inositol-1(or 4)-monophosphatase
MNPNDPALVTAVETLIKNILGTVDLTPHVVDRPADPVTNVDKIIDEKLYEGLLDLVKCGYVSEERVSLLPDKEDFVWIVDPIDGTHNLVAGFPEYGLAVALTNMPTREPQFSVCAMPSLGLNFVASKGNGAYCNGSRLYHRTQSASKFLVATEFSAEAYRDIGKATILLRMLMAEGFTLRQTGSAMYSICRVATGSLFGFVEQGVKLWDVIAADLVATESGCYSWSAPTAASFAEEGSLDYAVGYTPDALQTLICSLERAVQ